MRSPPSASLADTRRLDLPGDPSGATPARGLTAQPGDATCPEHPRVPSRACDVAEAHEVKVGGRMIVGPSVVDGELRLDRFETNGTVEVAAATNQGKCTSANSMIGCGCRWPAAIYGWWIRCLLRQLRSSRLCGRWPGAGPGAGEKPAMVRLRSLRGTDAEHRTLIDADLSRCILSGLRRPEQLRLEGRSCQYG